MKARVKNWEEIKETLDSTDHRVGTLAYFNENMRGLARS